MLDGKSVLTINANLSSEADITRAMTLAENAGIAFIGVSLHGPFEIEEAAAIDMMRVCGNPNQKPNSDVVRPILNADGIVKRSDWRWVVAFPCDMPIEEAAMYHAPFEFVRATVLPVRQQNHRKAYRDRWWIHGEARPAMQAEINRLSRFILTPRVGKHRIVVLATLPTYPSDATVVFTRDDDCLFGLLQSRLHSVWALRLGTRLETRPRYTPSTCFETFPLPECVWAAGGNVGWDKHSEVPPSRSSGGTALRLAHPTADPTANPTSVAIAAAARELDELRNRWLNPPEWIKTEVLEFPGSVDGPWARYIDPATVTPAVSPHPNPLPRGEGTGRSAPRPSSPVPIGTVRWPRTVPKDPDCAASLSKRTLTNLYNQRPTWLALAHKKLDEAVFAAYGWDPGMSDEDLLAKLLALNLERAGATT